MTEAPRALGVVGPRDRTVARLAVDEALARADKATALTRDLEELFGRDQIFLDKEDLAAGSTWREEVARTLRSRPILLVLITPQYLNAVDASGRRRLEQADDPARTELADALAANAHIVPLMCDGVHGAPPAGELPPPVDQLLERTWGRLRSYDWREDLTRLSHDLQALGLALRPGAESVLLLPSGDMPAGAAASSARRRLLQVGGGAFVAAAAAGLAVVALRRSPSRSLAGRWRARIGARGATSARSAEAVLLSVEQDGSLLRLSSGPVDIASDPDWQEDRERWQQRTGQPLHHVIYRGEGQLLSEAGEPIEGPGHPSIDRTAPLRIKASLIIRAEAGGEPVDSGLFRGTVEDEDQRVRGRLWLGSEPVGRVVELRRER